MQGKLSDLMWPYQRHYHGAAEAAAKEIFHRLDPRFLPRIFVIGFLASQKKNKKLITVYPETRIIGPALFAHIAGQPAEGRLVKGPAEMSSDRWQETQTKVAGITEAVARQESGWSTFCSWPVQVDVYDVHVVLQLQKDVLGEYDTISDVLAFPFPGAVASLVEALAQEFLLDCAELLRRPMPGAASALERRDNDELLRAAGKRFMLTPAQVCDNPFATGTLFDALCTVATLRYEGAEGTGSFLLANPVHADLDLKIKLDNPVPISNARAARKFLEISTEKLAVLCDGAQIFGLGNMKAGSNPPDLFSVEFLRHGEWQLCHRGRALLYVSYGIPSMPRENISLPKFAASLRWIVPDVSDEALALLWDAVREAARQKKGTILVISAHAASEAHRLAAQATLVRATPLTADLTGPLTAIDGAILLDTQGRCHAIGVILDGRATMAGDPSRGARYNAALHYIHGSNQTALAVVVSEDGQINLIPDRRPPLHRASILERVVSLETLAAEDVPDAATLKALVLWFDHHAFYLNANTCSRVNHALTLIHTKLNAESPLAERRPYQPHPELNDSYLLDASPV